VIPNKVYEGLAMGKPVITADTPAIRELATYGELPLVLIPAGDAKALAGAIRALLPDEPGRLRLGKEAAQFFKAHLAPKRLVGELLRDLPAAALRA
jgi:glycosyltransferase involved in cell wall biosynthesis